MARIWFQSLPRDSLFPNADGWSGSRPRGGVSIPPSGFSLPKLTVPHSDVVEAARRFNPSLGILSSQTPPQSGNPLSNLIVSIPPSGFSLPKLDYLLVGISPMRHVSIPPSGFSLPKLNAATSNPCSRSLSFQSLPRDSLFPNSDGVQSGLLDGS